MPRKYLFNQNFSDFVIANSNPDHSIGQIHGTAHTYTYSTDFTFQKEIAEREKIPES